MPLNVPSSAVKSPPWLQWPLHGREGRRCPRAAAPRAPPSAQAAAATHGPGPGCCQCISWAYLPTRRLRDRNSDSEALRAHLKLVLADSGCCQGGPSWQTRPPLGPGKASHLRPRAARAPEPCEPRRAAAGSPGCPSWPHSRFKLAPPSPGTGSDWHRRHHPSHPGPQPARSPEPHRRHHHRVAAAAQKNEAADGAGRTVQPCPILSDNDRCVLATLCDSKSHFNR